MTHDSQIVTFMRDESPLIDRAKVGGKGAGLFRLSSLGLTVAPFFVVTTDGFTQHISPVKSDISILLNSLGRSVTPDVAIISAKVRGLIRKQELSRSLRCQIDSELRTAFKPGTRLAVRSSSPDEDSDHASFAGMHDSRLNVPISEVFDAIVAVWESAFSERVLAYRIKRALALDDIAVAVVIQEFVETDISGVMFTGSNNGANKMTISAAFGLGEGVVSGAVETDTYLLPRNGGRSRREISLKRLRVIAAHGNGGGTFTEAVPAILSTRATLTRSQLRQLKATGLKLERALAAPQDVEWGYDSGGRLLVMQSRPITSTPQSHSTGTGWLFDNSNIVESYPGITLPLTFSFISHNYEVIFSHAATNLVLHKERLRCRTDIWRKLVVHIKGRVYYNLSAWYAMLSYLPFFDSYRPVWDESLGIAGRPSCKHTSMPVVDRIFCMIRVTGLLLFMRRNARKFSKQFRTILNGLTGGDFARTNELDLIGRYRFLEQTLFDIWPLTIYNDFCAFVYDHLLRMLCRRWGGSDNARIHHALSAHHGKLESVLPVDSLLALAALFGSEKKYQNLMRQSDAVVWQTIQSEPSFAPLRDALQKHIDLFGDRCYEELKLESQTFRSEPESLIKLMRNWVDFRPPGNHPDQSFDVYSLGFCRGIVLKIVANSARTAIANRERMRFARTRAYGIVRGIFDRLGTLMTERGVLDDPRDMFYLTVDEVFGAIEGNGATCDLQHLCRLRRSEFANYDRESVPPRFSSDIYPAFSTFERKERSRCSRTLSGTGCVSGVARGRACVVRNPSKAGDCTGAVLITQTTDPSWVFLMIQARAIVAERGSLLSHTAIVARELGIPTVVGAIGAVETIPPNAEVVVDGCTGEVSWN